MVFIGMFYNAAPGVTDIKDLTSEPIKAAIEKSVSEVRKKEPESRVIEAAMVGLRIPVNIVMRAICTHFAHVQQRSAHHGRCRLTDHEPSFIRYTGTMYQ